MSLEDNLNSGIWLLSCRTGSSDKKAEFLEKDKHHTKLKFRKNYLRRFKEGPVFGVSEKEFTKFWLTVEKQISSYVGINMEVDDLGRRLSSQLVNHSKFS